MIEGISSRKPIVQADWMRQRPYRQFGAYDRYYLDVANRVWHHLSNDQFGLGLYMDGEAMKSLAVSLTGYFEDFVNNIGIWAAVRRVNERFYGTPLPLFTADDDLYVADDMNIQDIVAMIWHRMSAHDLERLIQPRNTALYLVAGDIMSELGRSVDEAPKTDAYRTLFTVEQDITFSALRERLEWLAFGSYLFGPPFYALWSKTAADLDVRRYGGTQKEYERISNSLKSDYLFIKRSRWNAMSMPEWLVEIAGVPEPFDLDVLRTGQVVSGDFLLKSETADHYVFEFSGSREEIAIDKRSVSDKPDVRQSGSTLFNFSCVPWQGGRWMVNDYLSRKVGPAEMEKVRSRQPVGNAAEFFSYPVEKRREIVRNIKDMKAAFVDLFGSDMVIYPDSAKAVEALNSFYGWWFYSREKPVPPHYPDPGSAPDSNLAGKAMGMYFDKGKGLLLSEEIPRAARMLKAVSLTDEQYDDLFMMMFHRLPVSVSRSLAALYGKKNLRHPMDEEAEEWLVEVPEFFYRFYKPQEFATPIPVSHRM
jgi:hypothetical protein